MALYHNVDFTNTNLQEMSVKLKKKNYLFYETFFKD